MGAGTQTTTSNTTPKPYKEARPLINTALDDAMRLYNKGVGAQTYTGSTVIPFSQQTTAGMNHIMGAADLNMNGRGLSGQMQNLINNGGFTQGQQAQMAGMNALANNNALNSYIYGDGLNQYSRRAMYEMQQAADNPMLNSYINGDGMNSAMRQGLEGIQSLRQNANLNSYLNGDGLNDYARNAMQNWQRDANSQFDLNSNPFFQQVQQNMLDKAGSGINAQAAAAGRYGSGANQQILAREQGKIAADLGYNEYNNWQNRRQQANQNLFQGGQAATGNQMNAINMAQGLDNAAANIGQMGVNNQMNAFNARSGMQNNIANLGQQATANQMGAISQKNSIQNALFNAQQAGIGNMSNAFAAMQEPGKAAMGIGSMYEDLATRQMNDQLRIFNDQQNAPWDQVGRLMGVANLTSSWSPSRVTTQAPGPNPFLSGLSQASAGVGLLDSIGFF